MLQTNQPEQPHIKTSDLPAGAWEALTTREIQDVLVVRAERIKKLRAKLDGMNSEQKKQQIQLLKNYYRENPWDFISDWGFTFDPRLTAQNKPAVIPFILWPRQVEYLKWLMNRYRHQERGMVEKSRDCGVTWLSVGFAVCGWVCIDGFSVGFGSRKEQYVDTKGDFDSIFEKIRFFIDYIPKELQPNGWNPKEHSAHMRIKNPENDSSITGEAGPQIGRGGRKAVFFVDEAAFVENQLAVDNALSQNTNCQIDISTPNGNGNLFYKKRMERYNNTERLFVFDWRAQPLDAKLLTPSGWRLMGDIQQGDMVIGTNGKATKVVGIFSQGNKEVYKVTFNDGSSTECCADHLWSVIPRGNQRQERRHITKVLSLKDIMQDYVSIDDRGYKQNRYQIPLAEPVDDFLPTELPLDAYVLGCLLGDGSLPTKSTTAVGLTIGTLDKEDMVSLINAVLPVGCELKRSKDIQYWISANSRYRGGTKGRGSHNPVNAAIRDLGLAGKKSHNKFIPTCYLLASASERLDLLRGLMDTDGCVRKSDPGTARYSTTSKDLAEGVAFIAQTLGGVGKVSKIKVSPIAVFGDRKCKRRADAYAVDVRLPSRTVPFKLTRKIEAYKHSSKYRARRSMVGIEIVGEKPVQCIKVEADDGLYLTDNCIVTHNSDPRKNQAWYDRMVAEFDEITVAQEIDRDYNASQEDSFIPAKYITAMVDAHIILGFDAEGVRSTGFDPADVGDAKAAVNLHGNVITEADQLKDGDITQAIPWAFNQADMFRADYLLYDGDGMGAPTIKQALHHKMSVRTKVVAYHGSAAVVFPDKPYMGLIPKDSTVDPRELRKNKDKFLNFRAQTWTHFRDRAEYTYHAVQRAKAGKVINVDTDLLLSISSQCKKLFEIKAELSRPKRIFTSTGKIQVESKADMKKRNVQSPNLADAAVIASAVMFVMPKNENVQLPIYEAYEPSVRGVM